MKVVKPASTFKESRSLAQSEPAALALLYTLSQVMRRIYDEEWSTRGEVLIYRDVMAQVGKVNSDERKALEWLHYEAGGWWSWAANEDEQGPSFIPTPTWTGYFRARLDP